MATPSHTPHIADEQTKKRELRLLKNRYVKWFGPYKLIQANHAIMIIYNVYREAAKECRRKKKEYIKCLENRVAVLENQNKALIDELKTLKELYCKKSE